MAMEESNIVYSRSHFQSLLLRSGLVRDDDEKLVLASRRSRNGGSGGV